MDFVWQYPSLLGEITLASDGQALTGLWFAGQKHFAAGLSASCEERSLPVFAEAARWLDLYFAGRDPCSTPPLRLRGSEFRRRVWTALRDISSGKTVTYGELALRLGLPPSAARAVGGAVGRNPISLILPCHRVLGAKGSLTGYAGGLERKRSLLLLEGISIGK